MQRQHAEEIANLVPAPPGGFKSSKSGPGDAAPGAAVSAGMEETSSQGSGISEGIRSIVSWWKVRRVGLGFLLGGDEEQETDADMDNWF